MSSYQEWNEWKVNFLACPCRGLSKPDGRSLYKYRISKDEFDSLKTLMTDSVSEIKGRRYRDNYNQYGFRGLFVLYASEYFRQEYSGLEWYWVLKSLGIKLPAESYSHLYKCIESGLSEWSRCPNQSISDAGGRKWLGSLILEGGLPLPMLTDKECNLGNFLNRFIKKAESRRSSAQDIAKGIKLYKDKLSNTYQNETFYDLLAELVWTVLHLKAVARITSPVDIIGQLDAYDKDWRDEFPLRIDDDQTTALLETLVKEAIKIPRVFRFPVVRELKKSGEDWQLKSSITFPDQLDISSLHSTFFAEDAAQPDLPRKLEICLDHGKQCCLLRRIVGSEAYRPISNIRWELFGIDATTEHVLRLNSDGQVWSASATKGEVLDPDLPWVFEVDQDNFRFMRQGSGSIAAMEGIVVIPDDWNADDALRQVGKVPSLDRTVYQFSGTASIADGQGNNYQIRTGRTNAAEESYAMQGDRIWFGFLSPSLAYRGLPKLYTMDADCNIKPLGRPEWRALGSQTTTTAEPLGPVLATWLTESGVVRYRSKMVVLPLSAKISYEFVDHQTAKIRLKKWKAARAYTKTADIDLRSAIKNDGDDLEITLKYRGAKYPPEHIDLEVEWDHSPIPVQLHLPLPLRGARAFDPMGRPLEQGANIAVQQLAGVRLLALNGSQGNHPHLELEFESGHISATAVRTTIAGLQAELKLLDYSGEIHRLLSTDDRPEAAVKVSLRVEGKETLQFRVSRYTCLLEKDGETVRLDSTSRKKLDIEQLAALPVMALQLEYPGHDPIKLEPILSQGVATGSWFFDQQMRDPGSWLIYPANDAQVIFRRVVWYLPGDTEATSDLGQALGIDDDKQRQRALDAVIVALAEDYNHPEWSEVEHLVQKVGHLPLTFLDVWRRFARSPAGMAALAMRMGSISVDFISRFDKELPFAWETVPFMTWVKAMGYLKNQCTVYGETVFYSCLGGRVDYFISNNPALNFLLRIARSTATNETSQELISLRQQAPLIAEIKLFSQEDGCMQRLRRDHSEKEVWPEDFIGPVNEFRSTSQHNKLLCQERLGHHDSVINFPMLLAFQAATERSGEWFDSPDLIHALRSHQNFDQDWFTEAYDWTIARCLASDLIKLVELK